MTSTNSNPDAKTLQVSGLKAAFAILNKWGCRPDQSMAILGLSNVAYKKFQIYPEKAQLCPEQLERLSHIINIHAHLRALFENSENQYGFMKMKNHNPFFCGKSPLEIIATGHIEALYETHKHIEALSMGLS